ncbi:MAG: YtxH domain-containing protein [Pyrinomonadaceae bacterium MAG19_C2-C3]|nr:YtxH domain-containing protein [Pyrinomonadaceae bacterium MAG19_C2-C3]
MQNTDSSLSGTNLGVAGTSQGSAPVAQHYTTAAAPVATVPPHTHHDHEGAELSTKLTYFIVGTTIGAVVALMFAPKSGRELRGDIADVTRKGVDRSREAATTIGTKAGEYYEVTKDRASDLYETGKVKAGEVAARRGEQLNAAIDAGKQAYAEEKRRAVQDEGLDAPIYHGNPAPKSLT